MKRFKEFIKSRIEPILITALPVHGSHAKKREKVQDKDELKEATESSWGKTNHNAHLGKTLKEVDAKLHVPEKHIKKLPHYDHLASYTDSSSDVNAHLNRSASDPLYEGSKSGDDFAKKLSKHIDSHKPLEHDLHVYHGTNTWHPGKEAAKHPEGHVHIPTFMSTSLSKSKAHFFTETEGGVGKHGRHMLHIHLKPGQKGAYVGVHGSWENEHEFLLPHSQTLKIHPTPSKYKGAKIWHAEVVHGVKPPKKKAVKDIDKHIHSILDSDDTFKKITVLSHPKVTAEHITKALNDNGDYQIRKYAIQHPNATTEHITKALNDLSGMVRLNAIKHPKVTTEHIHQVLDNSGNNHYLKAEALRHPNVNKDHITKALNDEDASVRTSAMYHPKATAEHISKALNDDNWSVRQTAIEHPKATAEHITKALNHEDWRVRAAAIKHPKATAEHITKALNDENWGVRSTAISHPNATTEHITKALNDEHETVRDTAKKRLESLSAK